MKKSLFVISLMTFPFLSVQAQQCPADVVQEVQLQKQKDAAEKRYDVYAPVGEETIRKIKQAPRLDTLNGKTIALVGGSFMAEITHSELKRLILKNYPDAKIILLDEIGSAGPYPAPGVRRERQEEFARKLKEFKVDAVVAGNGGCGLCTPKEVGSCITAEHLGIPSVMIAAPGFVEQAKSNAYTNGVPAQRVATYPGAFSSHTQEELIKNTQDVLYPQIIEALTSPITEEEINAIAQKNASAPKTIAYSGTIDGINDYFIRRGWSDGLPIVPPTKERVEEFLRYTPYQADDVIGVLPVAYRKVTAFEVAVTGVMAGAKPEYMPILIAFTKAMTDGDFRRTLSSTHGWTPFCWLNGPLSRQLGFDSGQGEISASNNKMLGRFIDLAMLNLGGYKIKENRMGTFGYLSSFCLAENEEAALKTGWQTHQMQKGFSVNDNTLTAASSLSWGNNLTPATSDGEKIMELLAWDAVEKEQFGLGSGMPFVNRTVLITESVSRDLAKAYPTKESLEDALIKTARRPLDERAYAKYWANPGGSYDTKEMPVQKIRGKLSREENAETTVAPPWLKWTGKQSIETVPVMEKGKTDILVTGDANRNKMMTVPGGQSATIKIELPENWNELTTELGYRPIEDFYLKTSVQPQVRPEQKKEERRFSGTEQRGRQRQRPTGNRRKPRR